MNARWGVIAFRRSKGNKRPCLIILSVKLSRHDGKWCAVYRLCSSCTDCGWKLSGAVPFEAWLAVSSQGGQRLSRRHLARLGYWDRPVFTRPYGPRGSGALRPVRRSAGGQRCLWLHGQSVGPWDGDLPPHAAGPHQQSVLVTGEAPPYMLIWSVHKEQRWRSVKPFYTCLCCCHNRCKRLIFPFASLGYWENIYRSIKFVFIVEYNLVSTI